MEMNVYLFCFHECESLKIKSHVETKNTLVNKVIMIL